MRREHSIKPNKRVLFPQEIIFFDTETTPTKINELKTRHTLRLGMACYLRNRKDVKGGTKNWLVFRTKEALWEWVIAKTRPKSRLIITSFNLSFDMVVVQAFKAMNDYGYKLSSLYQKGSTTIIRFKRESSTILFLDTSNYFKGSLKRWGKLIGLPKIEVSFANVKDDELEEYCKRDVEILVRLWTMWFDFLRTHNLGTFANTVPAQAFKAFTHRFMKHRIWIHNNEDALALERNSYHGGRTEAFFIGIKNTSQYYYMDVNSMYPHVMAKHEYPRNLAFVIEDVNLKQLEQLVKHYTVIADVDVHVKEPVYCYKGKDGNFYPTGKFRTVLCTPEIQYGLERGYIKRTYSVAVYHKAKIFRDYVDFFYGLKVRYSKENNKLMRTLVKLFLNSLYGKFGQIKTKWEQVGSIENTAFKSILCVNMETGKTHYLYNIYGQRFEERKGGESYNSFPAIASHVTAHARMNLWTFMCLAGRENVYYCDTDSLILNQIGYDNVREHLDENRLGALKLERQSNRLEIRGRKDYTFGAHVRIKGIRKNAKQLAHNKYKQEVFPKLRGILLRCKEEIMYVFMQVKILRREVKWGVLQRDGTVRPYKL